MAELQAEDKKRADELQAEKERRAYEIRVQMAQTEADEELTFKEMELQAQQAQAQANTSPAATRPLLIKRPSPRSYHPL